MDPICIPCSEGRHGACTEDIHDHEAGATHTCACATNDHMQD